MSRFVKGFEQIGYKDKQAMDIICDVNKAAKWLHDMRLSKNYSLRDLATRAKLNHVTISKAEGGFATEKTWLALARYFDEDPQLVLFWANQYDEPSSQEDKEWAAKVYRRLERLPPEAREIAEIFIDALYAKSKEKKEKEKKNNNGKKL